MHPRARAERDHQQRQRLAAGSDRLRRLAQALPWLRVDVVDGQTVALDGGSIVLVIADRRREAMIRWTRVFDTSAVAALADLLDVASRTQHVPAPILDRLLRLADRSDVDTDLHPPRHGLGH
ncbi:hypothetical protein [Actinokineospora sp. NPDC004072]